LKIKLITIVTLILFFFGVCTICYATETGIVYLESNQSIVEKGEEIEITVNLKDSITAAFDFSLYYDSTKWDYISKIDNTNIKENHILYVWHDTEGGKLSKQGELVKFKFKAKEDGLSTFSIDGSFYNSSGQLIQTSFQAKQVQIGKEKTQLQLQAEEGTSTKKDNDNLQILRLNIEGITPEFDTNTYDYYLIVPNTMNEVEVLAVSENPNAVVNVEGNTNLKEGLNTVKIKVISEDKKEQKIYTIHVTKTANANLANTNLEILAIENTLLNPTFEASITRYSAEVSQQTENLNIFTVPENENAKVQITGGANLKEGDNRVTIVVTAENGFSIKKYEIVVHRRNQIEQEEYQKEQEQQAERVEEAYEIEKLSSEKEEENVGEAEKKNEKKSLAIVWIVVIIIIICGIGFLGFKFWRLHK